MSLSLHLGTTLRSCRMQMQVQMRTNNSFIIRSSTVTTKNAAGLLSGYSTMIQQQQQKNPWSSSSSLSSSFSSNTIGNVVVDGSTSFSLWNQRLRLQQQQQQQQQRRSMATWPKVRPRRIRMITFDVTGTIVSFRGSLEEHYLGAAAKYGVTDVDAKDFGKAFNRAYKETSFLQPCFGGQDISAKQWWRECVTKSFQYAGADMDDKTAELVFQRIYSTFGSINAYEIFADALPFLHWARRHGIVCGIISNADERYGDSILPMLGVTHDDLKFQCFSKDLGFEKPNPLIFAGAIERAQPFLTSDEPMDPAYVLHIGNDFNKDFEGARSYGQHAVLLDRYQEDDLASEWRRRGAPVFRDLLDVVEFLGRSNCKLG